MTVNQRLSSSRFPRASTYNPDWVIAAVSGGANPLWLTEWLAESLRLRPGMRVLDLGCGRGASSIFLHREFGVQVWATDLWFSASERLQRIRDAGVEDGVFSIHADARALPFPNAFFDAIVSIDSFPYYGTDVMYLPSLVRFVKTDGQIAIAGAAVTHEIDGDLPEHLREWWTPDLWALHSARWWQQHWERSGTVEVVAADTMDDGWQLWLDWQKEVAPANVLEIRALEADRGRCLGYCRVVARRMDAAVEEPIASVPVEYTNTPLLRGDIGGRG